MRENELKVLMSTHEQSLNEIKSLRIEIRKIEEEKSKIQSEYQTLQLTHESEITRISSDLRIKNYENERIKLQNEELKSINEDLNDEKEILNSKFNIIKNELLKFENEIKLKENQIFNLTEKIQLYEKLENELDNVIDNLDLKSNIPLALPSDANRRVKQSLLLSKRVLQLTTENNQFKMEIDKLKNEIEIKNEEINDLKNKINISSQPQQVFVSLISEKQNQINLLKKKLNELTQNNQNLLFEKDSIKKEIISNLEFKEDKNKLSNCIFGNNDKPTNDNYNEPEPFMIIRK